MIGRSAAEGIITIDDQGTVESFNESAGHMFGYDVAEVIGQNVKVLMPLNYRDAHERGLANYLVAGEMHMIGTTREVVGLRKDGTTFPLLISVNEMWLQERRLFAGIVLDMTELRLAQDRAVQAERLAAIGEAMAGLAHESRNALQRSQAALEMLARAVGDRADAVDLLRRIQSAQDDLHSLYEEVRGYAAPIIVRTQACRVDSLVQAAWERTSATRAGRDVHLDHTGTHIDLTCNLDPFPMQRVFRNILENSLDASKDPVRITITYSEAKLDGMPLEHSILIVENDAALLDLLTRNFTRRGYAVTPVCHPRQALEAATVNSFDLALLDGSLPEHDGIGLMRELKRHIADLQVIILSAHSDAAFQTKCIDSGAFSYLRKPCGLSELEATFERAIEHRASTDETRVSGRPAARAVSPLLLIAQSKQGTVHHG